MVIALWILFCIFLFLPILLWWIRNISRVMGKRDINIISDNLLKIFLVSFALSAIFLLAAILTTTL